MKTAHVIGWALPMAISLGGCYNEVDLDSYRTPDGENLLVINSILCPDSAVRGAATRTYFYSDRRPEREYVPGLDMELTVNDTPAGRLTFDPATRLYRSDVVPSEGDRVRVSTVWQGKEVTATDSVPRHVSIESVRVERQGPTQYYWHNDYIFTYYVTFSEPPGPGNYYFLKYDGWGDGLYGNMEERNYTYEYVFQQLAHRVQQSRPGWEPYSPLGLPFSDQGIDGTTHTLVLKEIVQGGYFVDFSRWTVMHRRFRLYAISEAYYRYLVGMLCADSYDDSLSGGMVNIGLVEPASVFSNIIGGTGIMASYSIDEMEIDAMEQVGPFPD